MSACVNCGHGLCLCDLPDGAGPSEDLTGTLQRLASGTVDTEQAVAEILPYLHSVQQVQDQLTAIPADLLADLPYDQRELLETTHHIALSMAGSVLGMATAVTHGDLTTAWQHLRTLSEAEALIGTLQAAAYAQLMATHDAMVEEDVEFETT
ncbi:MAG: GAT domain-containing protein [Candidatus Xenobia bacterium]